MKGVTTGRVKMDKTKDKKPLILRDKRSEEMGKIEVE
jgi:hypothetical protein